MESEVKFYNLSSNPLYRYEYRYELHPQKTSSNESALILLLGGRGRACIDWWKISVGEKILAQMRSAGFSILAICTPRKEYQVTMPIQENMDVYWIYTTLQMWMNEVYYRHFQHYPRLYLFGVSQGSRFASFLSRVLPVQAQILYIYPSDRLALMTPSEHSKAMQTRLISDSTFANWFYFDYCSNRNSTRCPFPYKKKNYLHPVPPTHFIHLQNDTLLNLSKYTSIVTDLRAKVSELNSTLFMSNETMQLSIVAPLKIDSNSMKENVQPWSCKPWSSRLFYDHLTNPLYKSRTNKLKTCWCISTNFLHFDQYPNITNTWSTKKQEEYRDYANDIKHLKDDFCQTVCGDILATHAMASRHVNITLNWLNDMNHHRLLYRIDEFLHRPLRLWMYNKQELVRDITYLTYQTAMNSSCGRYYHAYQMYSPEYFLQDYFRRLRRSSPLTRHEFVWTEDPLLADYYIIPHDYTCITTDFYRPTGTDFEYRSFSLV